MEAKEKRYIYIVNWGWRVRLYLKPTIFEVSNDSVHFILTLQPVHCHFHEIAIRVVFLGEKYKEFQFTTFSLLIRLFDEYTDFWLETIFFFGCDTCFKFRLVYYGFICTCILYKYLSILAGIRRTFGISQFCFFKIGILKCYFTDISYFLLFLFCFPFLFLLFAEVAKFFFLVLFYYWKFKEKLLIYKLEIFTDERFSIFSLSKKHQ